MNLRKAINFEAGPVISSLKVAIGSFGASDIEITGPFGDKSGSELSETTGFLVSAAKAAFLSSSALILARFSLS